MINKTLSEELILKCSRWFKISIPSEHRTTPPYTPGIFKILVYFYYFFNFNITSWSYVDTKAYLIDNCDINRVH
ncbi:hypothetical protein BpHYR1_002084 [Brachionus plicatilis]|uniref:Uncharacterized protein n=1 Tax=Brachionus plicatilis TaxID=10195 RepID=A0A3M7Q2X9_BRAPC|nr:hypothetical protein BpHYR1_002084 [Brachionus plicatilis]